jgi:uncharacterized ion transporter superfamily protein YfcC
MPYNFRTFLAVQWFSIMAIYFCILVDFFNVIFFISNVYISKVGRNPTTHEVYKRKRLTRRREQNKEIRIANH